MALYTFLEEELEEVVTEDGEPVEMVCMSDASIAFDEVLAFFRVEPIAVLVGDAAARAFALLEELGCSFEQVGLVGEVGCQKEAA